MSDEKKKDEKKRETKKEHVDPDKNATAFQNKKEDAAGRDWTKPRFFGGNGQV